MHYFVLTLVPSDTLQEEIESKVKALMVPFDHNLAVPKQKYYLTQEDIQGIVFWRGITDVHILAGLLGDWYGVGTGGVDEQGLYHLSVYNHQAKWDWWRIGGQWNGEMRKAYRGEPTGFNFSAEFETVEENAIPVKWIDHQVEARAILTPDGTWHEIGRSEEKSEWIKRLSKILQDHRDCIVVGLDVHR